MNNNVLTYAEYQKRLKELKTPEDIASFAQELIAPALAGNMTPEKKEAKPDELACTPCTVQDIPFCWVP